MFRRIQNKVTYFFINNFFISNTRLRFDLKVKRKTNIVNERLA